MLRAQLVAFHTVVHMEHFSALHQQNLQVCLHMSSLAPLHADWHSHLPAVTPQIARKASGCWCLQKFNIQSYSEKSTATGEDKRPAYIGFEQGFSTLASASAHVSQSGVSAFGFMGFCQKSAELSTRDFAVCAQTAADNFGHDACVLRESSHLRRRSPAMHSKGGWTCSTDGTFEVETAATRSAHIHSAQSVLSVNEAGK